MTEALFDVEDPGEGAAELEAPAILVRLRLETGPGRATATGRQGDALRVRVGAPAASEMAARAAGAVLAELFGVPAENVGPVLRVGAAPKRGAHGGRALVLRVTGVDSDEAGRVLERAADAGRSAGGSRGSNARATGTRPTH